MGHGDRFVASVGHGDRFLIKLNKYRNAGVREFWVIDPDKRVIMVWYFEQDDYGIYGFRDVVPVRIYGGELKIDFSVIDDYITGWM